MAEMTVLLSRLYSGRMMPRASEDLSGTKRPVRIAVDMDEVIADYFGEQVCAPKSRAPATEKEISGWSLDQVPDALRESPPNGDRERPAEIAAGTFTWTRPVRLLKCLPEIAVDTSLIKGSVFPVKMRKSQIAGGDLAFKLRLHLELG